MSRFGSLGTQYFDNAGDPLIDGKISFFESGTTTLKDTFADVNLTIANTNPVILSAAGRQPNIFFNGSARAVLTDKDDVQIEVRDPVGATTTADAFAPWIATIAYNFNDIVQGSDDRYYQSITNGNIGNDPVTSSGFWAEVRFIGVYDAAYTYQTGYIVIASDLLLYISLTDNNLNNDPTLDAVNWKLQGADVGNEAEIINGDFSALCWQRLEPAVVSFVLTGSTFTYTADRWGATPGTGGTATVTRQAFTLGQTAVPDEPEFFYRFDLTVAPSDRFIVGQRINNVRNFAGQTVTVSFFARGPATTVQVRATQVFGSGGSADVSVVSGYTLTGTFARKDVTLAVPSISGKTIGTGDTYLEIDIVFQQPGDPGGVVLGQYDFADCKIQPGAIATPFIRRPTTDELIRCLPFFQRIYAQTGSSQGLLYSGFCNAVNTMAGTMHYSRMRALPALSLSNVADVQVISSTNDTVTTLNFSRIMHDRCQGEAITTSSLLTVGDGGHLRFVGTVGHVDVNAEL